MPITDFDDPISSNTGTIRSEESKQKQSQSTTGVPKSEEHKASLSIANKGKPSSMKGIPKISVTCPHCNIIGAGGSMIRWHFDNCKLFQPSST